MSTPQTWVTGRSAERPPPNGSPCFLPPWMMEYRAPSIASASSFFDLTADVICTTPVDEAPWSLVDRGLLEHTWEIPVYFRRREGAELLPLLDEPPQPAPQLSLFPENPLQRA